MVTLPQVLLFRFINPPFTASMAWNWIRDTLSEKEYEAPYYSWRSLGEISPHLKKAVLAGEDQRFLSHHGFDLTEMDQAFRDFLIGRRVRGASTITMQVARTVFLWSGRSWIRKFLEAYYAVLIELLWSKKRIFEVYLNTVDWGEGIMGAEPASMTYFRTHSSRITPYQAALLAAILPNPHRWSPVYPNGIVKEKQRRILRDMGRMPLL